jgi:hypothetical protein
MFAGRDDPGYRLRREDHEACYVVRDPSAVGPRMAKAGGFRLRLEGLDWLLSLQGNDDFFAATLGIFGKQQFLGQSAFPLGDGEAHALAA